MEDGVESGGYVALAETSSKRVLSKNLSLSK